MLPRKSCTSLLTPRADTNSLPLAHFFGKHAGMKSSLRTIRRSVHLLLLLAGFAALLAAAVEFTDLPWRAYKHLSSAPGLSAEPPALILVMGGSGIPGDSGLMRTFYAAEAAHQFPAAQVLIAMPLDAPQSPASQAYMDELRLRGVAPDRLHILPDGRNTREQAIRMAEYLRNHPDQRHVLIVSSPEHIRRTAAALHKAFAAARLDVVLGALPAFPLSLEDPLPWRAQDLDTPATATLIQAAVPDLGSSLHLRYQLWSNLRYTLDSLREITALLYYRLRGWA